MAQSLNSFSWQQLQDIYKQYGDRATELLRIKETFKLAQNKAGLANGGRDLVSASFRRDVELTENMLILLDAEIARRNKLIGVMG